MMMIDFLRELKEQQISVSLNGDELVVSFQTDQIDPAVVQRIQDNKQELIAFLQKYTIGKDKGAIPNIPVQESYPMSDAQKRLWVLCQFKENLRAYNMDMQLDVAGICDYEKFIEAVQYVIERHEILRTNFKEDHTGEIRQWIKPMDAIEIPFEYEDLRGNADPLARVEEFIQNDSFVSFDLENGMLLRGRIFQINNNVFKIYLNKHHIIGDGWSEGIFIKELKTLYSSLVAGKSHALNPLKIQYKDYTSWQLDQINNGVWKKQEQYWLDYLSGRLPVLDLPSNKIRPNIKTSNGKTLKVAIPSDITAKLQSFGLENKGSLFISLLSIWYIVFHKYTNDKDIIVASPLAGREHPDLEDQLGFYVNTIALRNKIDVEETFLEFYERTTDILLSAFNNQMYPFDKLIHSLEIERDISRNPVYDIMISLLNVGDINKNINGYYDIVDELTITDDGYCMSRWDIEMLFKELDASLTFDLIFNPDVYEQSLIENVIRHYYQIMVSVVNNPRQKIKDIDFLIPEERASLMGINSSAEYTDAVLFSSILEAFQKQVTAQPDHIGLLSENSLSYQQIDTLSNQFADYLLQTYEIEKDTRIAIQLPRNNWIVIAILGIMKSGAAYIPMGLELPKKRSEYIIENSGCIGCIHEAELNSFIENLANYSEEAPAVTISSNQLAYTIYTSGSMGMPKGVMLTHANLASFLRNFETNFKFDTITKVGATTNYAFDISILELLGGLALGKSVSVFTDEEVADPHLLLKRIEDHQLDFVQFTPSRLRQLLEISPVLPTCIKIVMSGGEQLPQSLFDKFKTHNDQEVIHMYGPTETTIWSTYNIQEKGSRVVLGKPLVNEEIYILSEDLQLVPHGVVGEICIAGEGVARGYINNVEITKQKFVKHPFKKGAKIYQTGDLGKWTQDNELEFIGRKDSQLKLRGYRIELKEIERLLMNHEEVAEAVVVVIENAITNDKQLIAYVILQDKESDIDLKAYLQEYLPNYMIPALFSTIEKMPLNANGKIDRVELARRTIDVQSVAYEAPRNEKEKALVTIWEAILGFQRISIYDNFFQIGGNSLNVIKLHKTVNSNMNQSIDIVQFFNYPTIDTMATYIDGLNDAEEQKNNNLTIMEF
jgi:amino acid adenylation domain-containing protein